MTVTVAVEKKKLAQPPLVIYRLGDRVLRSSAKRIAKVDDEVRQIAREMLQTMYSSDGIGLAAPQVGINKRLIVIDPDPRDRKQDPIVLINPTIKKYGKEICTYEEGCLSVPDVFLEVKRPETIELSYKDENGRPRNVKVDGLLSRVIQHEMDHLEGVMFVDRVENKLALTEALTKYKFSLDTVKPII